MGFYERYSKVCAEHEMEPCSQAAADCFGITRATISSWNKKGTTPKGETVAAIASTFNVSCDYLLERTDDPTDYSNPDLIAEMSGAALDALNGDIEKAVKLKQATDKDALTERNGEPTILQLYEKLDAQDQQQIEDYALFLLSGDKYGKNGERVVKRVRVRRLASPGFVHGTIGSKREIKREYDVVEKYEDGVRTFRLKPHGGKNGKE